MVLHVRVTTKDTLWMNWNWIRVAVFLSQYHLLSVIERSLLGIGFDGHFLWALMLVACQMLLSLGIRRVIDVVQVHSLALQEIHFKDWKVVGFLFGDNLSRKGHLKDLVQGCVIWINFESCYLLPTLLEYLLVLVATWIWCCALYGWISG